MLRRSKGYLGSLFSTFRGVLPVSQCRHIASAPHGQPAILQKTEVESLAFHGDGSKSDATSKPKRTWWTPEEIASLIRLVDDSYSHAAISAQLPGRTVQAIGQQYWKHRQGLRADGHYPLEPAGRSPAPNTGKDYTEEDSKRIAQWLADPQDKKLAGLARELGRSVRALSSHIQVNLRYPYSHDSSAGRDILGRQRKKHFDPLERILLVYLRNMLGMKWHDIARQYPHRRVDTLRNSYHKSWLPKFKDIAVSDPRQWSDDQRVAFMQTQTTRKRKLLGTSPLFQRHQAPNMAADAPPHMSTWSGAALTRGQVSHISTWTAIAPARHCRLQTLCLPVVGRRLHSISPMSNRTRWTPEEDRTIEDMRAHGRTWSEVGEALNRSTKSASSRSKRLARMYAPSNTPSAVQLPKKIRKRWTPEDLKTLSDMQNAGRSQTEIAQAVGRTISSIESQVKGLRRASAMRIGTDTALSDKIPFSWWTEVEETMLLRLKNDGCSWQQIGEALPGRSYQAVMHHLRPSRINGQRLQPRFWVEADCEKLLELCDARKLPWEMIASLLGRSHQSVQHKYHKLKTGSQKTCVQTRTYWTPEEDAQES